jgi:hypothetical protein
MKIQKVKNFKDLVKVDSAYIVNTNEADYKAAINRRKYMNTMVNMEEKMKALEEKIEKMTGNQSDDN